MDEAPIASIITPGDSEEIISEESVYELNFEDKKYILTLSVTSSNKLIFKLKEDNIVASTYYMTINYLEELTKIDKQFRLYDTESEVYETLKDILNSKQCLIQKINENLVLTFLFPLPGNKKREIIIPLITKNYEQKDLNDGLVKKVNELEIKLNKEIQENKEYKNIIEEHKKLINELKDEIILLKKDINELKNPKIEKETTKPKKIDKEKYIDSNIIEEKREFELIENRLKLAANNRKINYKLLYRASTDGDKAEIFHDKCNEISGTLSIIKTSENIKFGGYTEALWDGYGFKKDEKAFCFSLNLNKIYNISIADQAIKSEELLGPRFANTLFGIYDDAFKEGGWCSYNNDTQYGKIENNEITGGLKEFKVSEVEVFQIIFD